MSREPKDYENRPLYDRLARKRFQTGLVLALENAVTAFWRLALWDDERRRLVGFAAAHDPGRA